MEDFTLPKFPIVSTQPISHISLCGECGGYDLRHNDFTALRELNEASHGNEEQEVPVTFIRAEHFAPVPCHLAWPLSSGFQRHVSIRRLFSRDKNLNLTRSITIHQHNERHRVEESTDRASSLRFL